MKLYLRKQIVILFREIKIDTKLCLWQQHHLRFKCFIGFNVANYLNILWLVMILIFLAIKKKSLSVKVHLCSQSIFLLYGNPSSLFFFLIYHSFHTNIFFFFDFLSSYIFFANQFVEISC